MKRKIKISNTHRYLKQTIIQFNGYVDVDLIEDGFVFTYREKDNTRVRMTIHEHYMKIERFGEAKTCLVLRKGVRTKNPINSIYGSFEIDIYTYDYQNDGNYIRVEYDIENGTEDKDGFIVELQMKEGQHEFH